MVLHILDCRDVEHHYELHHYDLRVARQSEVYHHVSLLERLNVEYRHVKHHQDHHDAEHPNVYLDELHHHAHLCDELTYHYGSQYDHHNGCHRHGRPDAHHPCGRNGHPYEHHLHDHPNEPDQYEHPYVNHHEANRYECRHGSYLNDPQEAHQYEQIDLYGQYGLLHPHHLYALHLHGIKYHKVRVQNEIQNLQSR